MVEKRTQGTVRMDKVNFHVQRRMIEQYLQPGATIKFRPYEQYDGKVYNECIERIEEREKKFKRLNFYSSK